MASKPGKMPPSQPVLEGARPWSRIFFTTNSPYSLSCGSSSCCMSLGPSQACPPHPRQRKPKRKRSTEPKAFEGLTHKPHCALCEQETAETAPPPPLRPDPMPPTNRRPRTVDTSMHFCPHTDCDYRGWLGLNNLRANGHPSGGPWRQFHCTRLRRLFSRDITARFFMASRRRWS